MEENPTGPIHFLNLEYFFRLVYDAVVRGQFSLGPVGGETVNVASFFSTLWLIITILSFLISVVALFVLLARTVRIYQVYQEEEEKFSTLTLEAAERKTDTSRWRHILALVASAQAHDWRQAIIEADIMLEETLIEHQFDGTTTQERLDRADGTTFTTLEHAREAHEIRKNLENPAFVLTDHAAYRAIKDYELVLEEFDEIDKGLSAESEEHH